MAGAATLGRPLPEPEADRLLAFAALLQRWNAVHNLTAIDRIEELLIRHLLDSIAIVPHLDAICAHQPCEVLDVGSGGGLPGIPLAVLLPTCRFTLLDCVQKKCAFLRQAAIELGLGNVRVEHARVQSHRGQYGVITARAFATLADLVRWTRHLLARDGRWLAMKGRIDPAEIAALGASARVARIAPLVVPGLDEQRHLIELRRE